MVEDKYILFYGSYNYIKFANNRIKDQGGPHYPYIHYIT